MATNASAAYERGTEMLDSEAIWRNLVDRKYRRGPWPALSLKESIAVLALDARDDRTRARLVVRKLYPAKVVVEFYRHMSWGNGIEYALKKGVADELRNSKYLEAIPQRGTIFPHVEQPLEVHYRISRSGRETLREWLAQAGQPAAP